MDGIPAEIKKEEGEALRKLWARHKKRTQAEFMGSMDLSPNYLPQFFSGLRPINMKLAIAIANELDVDIVKFSPRLAKAADKALEASDWPFKRFTRSQYHALTKAQKEAVEAFVVAFLPDSGVATAKKFPRLVKEEDSPRT